MPSISEMARKNQNDEWVCNYCGENLGAGHHAKVLAHFNSVHNPKTQGARKEAKSTSSEPCAHTWRMIKPDDAGGRGQVAIKKGYSQWCPECGVIR